MRIQIATALLLVNLVVSPLASGQDIQSPDLQVVGRISPDLIMTPVNQILTPLGRQVELPGVRPQVLALSPDGRLLVTSGKTNELIIVNPDSGEIRQRVVMPANQQTEPAISTSINIPLDKTAQVSFTGLVFANNGDRIYMSGVGGSIKVFTVDQAGGVLPSHSIVLPDANAPRRKPEIPSGLAISADGSRLYVCGNLSNQLFEVDTRSGQVLRKWSVGVAPYDVVLTSGKAFVSNWGGRLPSETDLTGPAGKGTVVRVDPVRHIASEGSVSIITLDSDNLVREVITGLHASGLAVSPDKKYVVCANAGSDQLSVIHVESEQIVDTIWARSKPSDLFGASPNALAFDKQGEHLLVANGTQNAIAVVEFEPGEKGESKIEGLIPVGWFPGAVVFDASRNAVYTANIKGLPMQPKQKPTLVLKATTRIITMVVFRCFRCPPKINSQHSPSVSPRTCVAAQSLKRHFLRARSTARAIPERIGEPSYIKHVVYFIKENRTYDQVFGAIGRGRSRPDLCIFGREITPNQHKLVDEFILLDNTYCAGILSADGHQWSTTAIATDYMEKSFAGFPRSYPDGMGIDEADALAYSPAGFLWDNATLHNKTIRNYGEFMMPKVRWRDPAKRGTPSFLACFQTWKGNSDDVIFECAPAIESIRSYSPTHYVGWEMAVPDQFRADVILNELKAYETKGEFPQLVIVCLPNDHASGTKPGFPTPASQVADNDLAFGRIIEALSHSKFWKEMAIFGIEDDPQDGWDHVSGYRTTAYCVSPYARRNAIVSTQYNTTSVLRTIEQILGLPPMNQFDASATPMFDCFVDMPNLTPFDSVANRVPLDQMNPDPKAILNPILRNDAIVSSTLNFEEVDKAPEDVLNQILWRAMKGTELPYPAWAVAADVD